MDTLSRFLRYVFFFGCFGSVLLAISIPAIGFIADRKFSIKPETKEERLRKNRWTADAMGIVMKVLAAIVLISAAYVAVCGFPQELNDLFGTKLR